MRPDIRVGDLYSCQSGYLALVTYVRPPPARGYMNDSVVSFRWYPTSVYASRYGTANASRWWTFDDVIDALEHGDWVIASKGS